MTTIKEWLAQNGYEDILKRINAVERGWGQKGTGTRRNWWDVLAGNEDGTPKIIEGKKFPVLCAARKHNQIWLLETGMHSKLHVWKVKEQKDLCLDADEQFLTAMNWLRPLRN